MQRSPTERVTNPVKSQVATLFRTEENRMIHPVHSKAKKTVPCPGGLHRFSLLKLTYL